MEIRNYSGADVAMIGVGADDFLMVRTLYPCEGRASVRLNDAGTGSRGMIPVRYVRRELVGLPEPNIEDLLLVTCEVAKAAEAWRHDLLIPMHPVMVPNELRYAAGIRCDRAEILDGVLSAQIARECARRGLVCYGYGGFMVLASTEAMVSQMSMIVENEVDAWRHYEMLRRGFERQLVRAERLNLHVEILQREVRVWSKLIPRMCFGIDDTGLHRFLLCLREYEESLGMVEPWSEYSSAAGL